MDNQKNKLTFLDCTIRDGGYYNRWLFDLDFVNNYLNSIKDSGVSVVELGFRRKSVLSHHGVYTFTPDEHLRSLSLPPNIKIALMINAKEFAGLDSEILNREIKQIFSTAALSSVKIVRIASLLSEIEVSKELSNILSSLGYLVILNLMQCDQIQEEVFKVKMRNFEVESKFSVIYFADSFGTLNSDGVRRVYNMIRDSWSGPIGFHAHNNMGRAVQNAISAIECGATWIDSTVTGMGRGAGNAETENLLSLYHSDCQLNALFKFAAGPMQKLKDYYGWGTNIYYFLAALKNVHPSYIQEILARKDMSSDEIIDFIEAIEGTEYSKFDDAKLARNTLKNNYEILPRFSNKQVLLLANSDQLMKSHDEIENFIKEHRPFVISLNEVNGISPTLIDAYAFCNARRIVQDLKNVMIFAKEVIVPRALLETSAFTGSASECKFTNYELTIDETNVQSGLSGCQLPRAHVMGYVMSYVLANGCSNVLLAGFEGHKESPALKDEAQFIIGELRGLYPNCKVTSLTATQYNLS